MPPLFAQKKEGGGAKFSMTEKNGKRGIELEPSSFA